MNIKSIIYFINKHINQFLWSLALGYKHIPYIATIELTSRCNAHCIYCGRDALPYVGDMTIEAFKKIIDAIPFVQEVGAYAIGESLMHPNFIEAITYAESKGKNVVIFTNGSLLTPKLAKEILDAGLYKLVFSVDVDNKEDYESIRIPLKWDNLVNNIKTIMDLKKNNPVYKTTIMVRITQTLQNNGREKEIINYWKDRVDDVTYRKVRTFFVPGSHPITSSKEKIKCKRIVEEIVIRSDGTVPVCCDDWYYENVVGHINFETVTENDILDLFNSDIYNKFRRNIKNGTNYPYLCDVCVPRINEVKDNVKGS